MRVMISSQSPYSNGKQSRKELAPKWNEDQQQERFEPTTLGYEAGALPLCSYHDPFCASLVSCYSEKATQETLSAFTSSHFRWERCLLHSSLQGRILRQASAGARNFQKHWCNFKFVFLVKVA